MQPVDLSDVMCRSLISVGALLGTRMLHDKEVPRPGHHHWRCGIGFRNEPIQASTGYLTFGHRPEQMIAANRPKGVSLQTYLDADGTNTPDNLLEMARCWCRACVRGR